MRKSNFDPVLRSYSTFVFVSPFISTSRLCSTVWHSSVSLIQVQSHGHVFFLCTFFVRLALFEFKVCLLLRRLFLHKDTINLRVVFRVLCHHRATICIHVAGHPPSKAYRLDSMPSEPRSAQGKIGLLRFWFSQ